MTEASAPRRALPLIRPSPARLSGLSDEIAAIERSGIYSNYGPVNTRFEHALVAQLFGGVGNAVTACNATIALMLALKQATAGQPAYRRFALMPAFTFAATAHAAIWAGLTPLLCDIAADTWLADARAEKELLSRHGEQTAVVVACTTFGNPIDLRHYRHLATDHGCAIVVDAAAALGSGDGEGIQFAKGAPEITVFSMQATKAFATLEAGVSYSADPLRIDALRAMGNFGFEEGRSATLPGLNAKLNELTAALALAKLEAFPAIVARRHALERAYRELLPEFQFQRMTGAHYAPMFVPILLPPALAAYRQLIRGELLDLGIHTGTYFDPHLARQPYLRDVSVAGDLGVTDAVSARVLALPMFDALTVADVETVARTLRDVCRRFDSTSPPRGSPARMVAASAR